MPKNAHFEFEGDSSRTKLKNHCSLLSSIFNVERPFQRYRDKTSWICRAGWKSTPLENNKIFFFFTKPFNVRILKFSLWWSTIYQSKRWHRIIIWDFFLFWGVVKACCGSAFNFFCLVFNKNFWAVEVYKPGMELQWKASMVMHAGNSSQSVSQSVGQWLIISNLPSISAILLLSLHNYLLIYIVTYILTYLLTYLGEPSNLIFGFFWDRSTPPPSPKVGTPKTKKNYVYFASKAIQEQPDDKFPSG